MSRIGSVMAMTFVPPVCAGGAASTGRGDTKIAAATSVVASPANTFVNFNLIFIWVLGSKNDKVAICGKNRWHFVDSSWPVRDEVTRVRSGQIGTFARTHAIFATAQESVGSWCQSWHTVPAATGPR